MVSCGIRGAYQATDDGQYFVLSDDTCPGEWEVSGRWIRTQDVVEVEP